MFSECQTWYLMGWMARNFVWFFKMITNNDCTQHWNFLFWYQVFMWISSTYLSPSLNFYKQARSNKNGSVLADLGSVSVWEVGISFPLLTALLPGLLLQHMFHASICFVGCKRSDPSVLAAGKWRSQPEILANTGTDLEKKKQWILFCHLHCCYTTQGQKHPLPLLLLEQLANVHWFNVDMSVNHTYQQPPPQI